MPGAVLGAVDLSRQRDLESGSLEFGVSGELDANDAKTSTVVKAMKEAAREKDGNHVKQREVSLSGQLDTTENHLKRFSNRCLHYIGLRRCLWLMLP